jgi:hypothetical protein
MSLQALGIVAGWSGLTTTEIALSFHLANCANAETGACFPSVAYLAKKLSVTTRTIQRTLSDLEEKGRIKRVFTYNNDGKQQTSAYIFYPDTSVTPLPDARVTPEGDARVTHNQEDLTRKKERKNKQKEIPDHVDKELWAEWMEVRKKKKAVNSPTAINALLNRLHDCEVAGYEINFAIGIAVEESWKSINPGWIKNKLEQSNETRSRDSKKQPTRSEIHREAYRRYAINGTVAEPVAQGMDSGIVSPVRGALPESMDQIDRRDDGGRRGVDEGMGQGAGELLW